VFTDRFLAQILLSGVSVQWYENYMSSESRAQHKERIRNHILGSARELFVQDGYENFSMRKLATKVGCSPGNLYLYFRSKEQIFHSLVEKTFARLTTLLSGLCARNESRDPVETLKKGLYTYVEFALRNPQDYRFAFLMNSRKEQNDSQVPAPISVLATMVARCVEEGRIVRVETEVITQALWAAAHGLASLMIQRPTCLSAGKSRVIEQLIASIVAGMETNAAPQHPSRSLEASVA
jgi:AcrR family transcriptional regulator